ncbi:stability/partitioning determinant (plasmid) [Serratia sp. SCBI]|nr:stability/partitioning determinant [Serratia sp. SCBI]
MTVISDVSDKTIGETIADAATKTPFVIVDLEGTAATIVAYAIAESDFVVVPTQGSQLDAEQASRAFGLIRAHERGIQKHKPDYKLPYAVLFTRTSAAIQSRDTRHIRKSFEAGGIPFFETELNERAAFKAMFSYRQPLEMLPTNEVSNVEKAIENAEAFTREVIGRITAGTPVTP